MQKAGEGVSGLHPPSALSSLCSHKSSCHRKPCFLAHRRENTGAAVAKGSEPSPALQGRGCSRCSAASLPASRGAVLHSRTSKGCDVTWDETRAGCGLLLQTPWWISNVLWRNFQNIFITRYQQSPASPSRAAECIQGGVRGDCFSIKMFCFPAWAVQDPQSGSEQNHSTAVLLWACPIARPSRMLCKFTLLV